MAQISAIFFGTTATAPLFFTLTPPQCASAHASGTVALKVAQVPSTEEIYSVNAYRFKHPTLVLKVFRFYLENYETF